MRSFSLKNGFKKIFFWVLCWIFFTSGSVFAFSETKGDLMISVKIGNEHGGTLTYSAYQKNGLPINAQDFGLQINSDDFLIDPTLQLIPSEWVLKFTDNNSLSVGYAWKNIKVTLNCLAGSTCASVLDLEASEFLEKSIFIEPNKVNYLNFTVIPVKPLNQENVIGIKASSYADDNYNQSALITVIGKMAQKSNMAMDWALQLNDNGYYNQGINYMFQKVINIINGFLIIALLLIAAGWNFSFLISTKTLRKSLFFFIIISVIVNFTLPANRLILDIADSVQRSFLTKADGTMLTSKDFLAVNMPENWEGQIQDSWTRVGVNETFWVVEDESLHTDFTTNISSSDSQVENQIALTPKGLTTVNAAYLTAYDCVKLDKFLCTSVEGYLKDCSMIDLPKKCTIGESLIVAVCDAQSDVPQWKKLIYRCN